MYLTPHCQIHNSKVDNYLTQILVPAIWGQQSVVYPLKDIGNTLVALVASQYLAQAKLTNELSRFEAITKSFKLLLEQNLTTVKSSSEYAKKLNISSMYLNECVKNAMGAALMSCDCFCNLGFRKLDSFHITN